MANQDGIYSEERWFAGFVTILLASALFFIIRWEVQGRYVSDITVLWDIDVATAGFLAGWFAMFGNRSAQRTFWKYAVLGGLIGLAAGFLLGVIVPLLLRSNLGPLLGIFFTMPLGIPVGAVVGLILRFVLERTRVA